MKIKFHSDDELPLNKAVSSMITAARGIFLENNKYYPQAFLDECLHKMYKWKAKLN